MASDCLSGRPDSATVRVTIPSRIMDLTEGMRTSRSLTDEAASSIINVRSSKPSGAFVFSRPRNWIL